MSNDCDTVRALFGWKTKCCSTCHNPEYYALVGVQVKGYPFVYKVCCRIAHLLHRKKLLGG